MLGKASVWMQRLTHESSVRNSVRQQGVSEVTAIHPRHPAGRMMMQDELVLNCKETLAVQQKRRCVAAKAEAQSCSRHVTILVRHLHIAYVSELLRRPKHFNNLKIMVPRRLLPASSYWTGNRSPLATGSASCIWMWCNEVRSMCSHRAC